MGTLNVGKMPCTNEDCASHADNRPVILKLSTDTAVLKFTCDECGARQHARLGMEDQQRESWIARYCKGKEDVIRSTEQEVLARKGKARTTPAPAPAPAPKPAPQKAEPPAGMSRAERREWEAQQAAKGGA